MDLQAVAKPALDVFLWSSIVLILFLFLMIKQSSLPDSSKRNVRLVLTALSLACLTISFPAREIIANIWRTNSLCKLSKTHFESEILPPTGLFFSGPYGSRNVLMRNKELILYMENIDWSSIKDTSGLYEEEAERSKCLLVDAKCGKHPLIKHNGIKYEWTGLIDGFYRTTKQEHALSTYEVSLTTAILPTESRKQSFSTTGIDIRISERDTDRLIAHHRTYQSELGFSCQNSLASDFEGEIAEFISRSIAEGE